MRPVADPRRGVVEFARLLFCCGHEFGQRRIGQCRPDQHDRRQVGHVNDRREGGVRIVGQFGRQRVRHGIGPDLGEEQRVAVRLLARHGGRGDCAAGTGPVLHDQAAARWRIARSRSPDCATACRPRRPRRPAPAAEPGVRAIAPPDWAKAETVANATIARTAIPTPWRRTRLAKSMALSPPEIYWF